MESKLQLLRKHVRTFPDFPKPGIQFRDICPILKSPSALTAAIDLFEEQVRALHPQVDLIVGLDARGFLFGPLLAQRLGIGFVPVRKKGKLPGTTVTAPYELEYGKLSELIRRVFHLDSSLDVIISVMELAMVVTLFIAAIDIRLLHFRFKQETVTRNTDGFWAELEIQQDAVAPAEKIVLIDDLLATGGTLCAACELLLHLQAQVLGCLVVIELQDLRGAERLKPHAVFSLLQY